MSEKIDKKRSLVPGSFPGADSGLISKIISGGQTGADQAALDFAIDRGIAHGGWVPKGRKTEGGILPEKYLLTEMETTSYPRRTEKNVLESDGTLIVSHGNLTGGPDYTRQMALKHGRPFIHIDADAVPLEDAVKLIWAWIDENDIEVLNVAGARASLDEKIYPTTKALLEALL